MCVCAGSQWLYSAGSCGHLLYKMCIRVVKCNNGKPRTKWNCFSEHTYYLISRGTIHNHTTVIRIKSRCRMYDDKVGIARI